MAWTAERVESLKDLWAQGYSASQIASRIGGCTRNAVIGKVHRLGLPGRATTSRARPPRRHYQRAAASSPGRAPAKPKRPQAPKKDRGFELAPLADAAVLAAIDGVAPDDFGIDRRPLAELEREDCHWPIGDPRKEDFGFCGAAALLGRPYCEKHAARAFRAEY